MEPWKLVSEKVTQTARVLVSRDKYRLKDEALGVDLDLTYITDRIIAMGIPTGKFDALYRNHEDDVAKYFNTRHPGHYMIYNLSEKHYSYGKFHNAVQNFGWPDHHAPTLPVLCDLVQAMASWLSRSPENVIAVHCKAGRGRTGTAISCLLYYLKICENVSSALWFFADKRSRIGEGVEGPSQIRMCNYFQYTNIHGIPATKKLILTSVEFRPIPGVGFDGKFCPAFELCSPMTPKDPFYTNLGSQELRYSSSDYNAKIFCNQEVQGDLLIRVFHQTLVPGSSPSLIFRVQVHTSFLKTPFHEFRYSELDNTTAGPLNDNRYPSNFSFTLHFGSESPFDSLPVIPSPDRKTLMLTPATSAPEVSRRYSMPPAKHLTSERTGQTMNVPQNFKNSYRSDPAITTSPIVDRRTKPLYRTNSGVNTKISTPSPFSTYEKNFFLNSPAPVVPSSTHITSHGNNRPSSIGNIPISTPPPLIQIYDTAETFPKKQTSQKILTKSQAPTHTHKRSSSRPEETLHRKKISPQLPVRGHSPQTSYSNGAGIHLLPISSPAPNWSSLSVTNHPNTLTQSSNTRTQETEFQERMKNLMTKQ